MSNRVFLLALALGLTTFLSVVAHADDGGPTRAQCLSVQASLIALYQDNRRDVESLVTPQVTFANQAFGALTEADRGAIRNQERGLLDLQELTPMLERRFRVASINYLRPIYTCRNQSSLAESEVGLQPLSADGSCYVRFNPGSDDNGDLVARRLIYKRWDSMLFNTCALDLRSTDLQSVFGADYDGGRPAGLVCVDWNLTSSGPRTQPDEAHPQGQPLTVDRAVTLALGSQTDFVNRGLGHCNEVLHPSSDGPSASILGENKSSSDHDSSGLQDALAIAPEAVPVSADAGV
ncbi:MAG TPA: hypothetical protein VL588_13070 [Bdellovibrionota bacterium]|jgi:hypothetical protein|nr:hypothetical protein [Bdellovibrionota bacterium]